jgi:hypothetical protein
LCVLLVQVLRVKEHRLSFVQLLMFWKLNS